MTKKIQRSPAMRAELYEAEAVTDMLLLCGEEECRELRGAEKLRALIDGLIVQRRRAEKAEAALVEKAHSEATAAGMVLRQVREELRLKDGDNVVFAAKKLVAENKHLESEWSKAAQLNDDQAMRIGRLEDECSEFRKNDERYRAKRYDLGKH